MKKQSLLQTLRGLYPEFGKDELYAKILCGEVKLAGHTEKNPQRLVGANQLVELARAEAGQIFVSRAGEKLAKGLETFGLNVEGLVCIDAGASTGGFTDCLLQKGARFVYSVDSGKNQLDYRLRSDPRVSCREETRIQDFLAELAAVEKEEPSCLQPDLLVMDISFRSVLALLRPALSLVRRQQGIVLCKPQFEREAWRKSLLAAGAPDDAGRDFHGVVEEAEAREIFTWFCEQLQADGIELQASCESPIKGNKGNSEYLLLLKA